MTARSFAISIFAFTMALAGSLPVALAHDHASLQRVLSAHAHAGGMDYAALASDTASRADLDRFVASLGSMPDASPLADWLNAYNAIVIQRIVQHWPIASVRDVPGFFDRVRTRVAGQERTLDDLENRVIRERFHDARVHVAMNCGAVSCPPLPSRAFETSTLSATLDRLARSVVASNAFVRVDGTRVFVSELFFWFEADFTRDAGSVLAWLKRYDATHRLDAIAPATVVQRTAYRWAVNHHPR
jgi:hypothetical protein